MKVMVDTLWVMWTMLWPCIPFLFVLVWPVLMGYFLSVLDFALAIKSSLVAVSLAQKVLTTIWESGVSPCNFLLVLAFKSYMAVQEGGLLPVLGRIQDRKWKKRSCWSVPQSLWGMPEFMHLCQCMCVVWFPAEEDKCKRHKTLCYLSVSHP